MAVNLSPSSPERRGGRRRKRGRQRRGEKWSVATMTRSRVPSSPEPVAAPSVTLGRASPAEHRKGEWGGEGQPGDMGSHHGAKLSSIPLCTHRYTHYSHPHPSCPLDLTVKTQEQISRLVTAAQKQMMPNT